MELSDLDVLILDDHEAMQTLLARVFSKAGVSRVRTASNGADALAALRERAASLILADQNMPGMDGIAFISAVRSDTATFGAPRIIMISGKVSAAHTATAQAAGADAILEKPILPSALLAAINALFAV